MELFHVLNRGVDKRAVVQNDDDRQRFVRSLFLFNDKLSAPNSITQLVQTLNLHRKRELLVDIHSWCLMDNHYHLLVSPIDDDLNYLSLFMKKLNMGYAKFFNEKYERSGALWQGKYKRIQIERDAHFLYIPYYIHLNPLDYVFPEWREGKVAQVLKAIVWLKNYRWSSFLDYQGIGNYPSIISPTFIRECLGDPSEQMRALKNIITNEDIATDSLKIES